MTERQLREAAVNYLQTSPGNRLQAWQAIKPELTGMRMFDSPIMGVASAQDSYLLSLQNNPEAGLNILPPTSWLGSAQSVVSLFFPFSEQVRESNRRLPNQIPSPEMIHVRNEGQIFINNLCEHLKEVLEKSGYKAVIPVRDERYEKSASSPPFFSNWSERHLAFAAGIGTFSLSGVIITEKGAAGRLASLITDLKLPPARKSYYELDEYCTMCAVCTVNCPVNAINPETGLDKERCRSHLESVEQQPEYLERNYVGSCGKCQIDVPCEHSLPSDDDH